MRASWSIYLIIGSIHSDIIHGLWFFNRKHFSIENAYKKYKDVLIKFPKYLTKEIDEKCLYKHIHDIYFKILMIKASRTPNKAELSEQNSPVSYNFLMNNELPELRSDEAEELIGLIDGIKPNELQLKIREHALKFLDSPKLC